MNSKSTYDIIIVCCGDSHQANYWTSRLTNGICKKSTEETDSIFPIVLAVSEEDWGSGGAGNGLGTLHAFKKATALALKTHNINLLSLLSQNKISAALYHTAGKGTRLAPLPASENNNKPGVRLPATTMIGDSLKAMTVLEAVIKNTGVYAVSRKGRLSVFWGDQVFIPSMETCYVPTHHIDIMCTLGVMADAEQWKVRGLDKYGVIAVNSDGDAAQIDKVSHEVAVKMLDSLGSISNVGPSLGSFSVSAYFLEYLQEEFGTELEGKVGKLDTDPHFWMPLTLKEEDYITLMETKGVSTTTSTSHYSRMKTFKAKVLNSDNNTSEMRLFTAVDVGESAAWWDYGMLKLYQINNMKLTENTHDSNLLRSFLGVTSRKMASEIYSTVVDDQSVVLKSVIQNGSIRNSVISCVNCLQIEAEGAILVNVTARKIKAGKGAILYNIIDDSEEGVTVNEDGVVVSVFEEDGSDALVKSSMEIDGGKAWSLQLPDNSLTFEQLHNENKGANVSLIEIARNRKHEEQIKAYSLPSSKSNTPPPPPVEKEEKQ